MIAKLRLAVRVHQTGREQHHSQKAAGKQYRMARMEELECGGRRNRAGRSQESPLQAPPWLCLHLEKNLFSKVTFHLPV